MFSGEIKLGGKYRYKNRFKETFEVLRRTGSDTIRTTRATDGSIQAKNFQGTRFQNLQMVGRLVLLTNFLASSPVATGPLRQVQSVSDDQQDALREWYELNKNGIGNGKQLEYYNDPEQSRTTTTSSSGSLPGMS